MSIFSAPPRLRVSDRIRRSGREEGSTTTTTRGAAWFAAALAALVALAIAAPAAGATSQSGLVHHPTAGAALGRISPPPKPSGYRMHWFHSEPSARTLESGVPEFGSTVVLGLESMRDLESLRDRYGFDGVEAIPELHAAKVSVDPTHLQALLANAPGDRRIRYVSPLGPSRRLLGLPNDPLLRTLDPATNLPYEWQFSVSGVDRALDLSAGSPKIVVGTIDSGAAEIPDLAGKVDARWHFAGDNPLKPEQESSAVDEMGHGTAVASLIAANVDDGFGMAGFGGATHVIAFRVNYLHDLPIAVAIEKLVSLGVRIINMSIGGHTPESPILVDALHAAAAAGVLIVAAAGNEAGSIAYPAAHLQPAGGGRSFGLSVGASDLGGNRASFSNTGANLSLVAPGNYSGNCSGVLVALPSVTEALNNSCFPMWDGEGGARYGQIAGTSFSAPEVSGIAALIWAARPELKNYEVADIIKQSARRSGATGWTPTMGCGVLDAGAALELATGRSTAGPSCSAAGDGPPVWAPVGMAPTVVALAASGSRGATVRLPFRVGDGGEVAATVAVQKGATTIARLTRGFFEARSGQVYPLAWRAPEALTGGTLRFCVTLSDRAGNKSAPSCAPIRLR